MSFLATRLSTAARCCVPTTRSILRLSSVRFNSKLFPKDSPVGKLGNGIISKFTPQHEWISVNKKENIGYLGITRHATDALGDIVFIELPQINQEILKDESIGAVESVKSASEIYSPITGKIIEINDKLVESPKIINQDPYGNGWIAKVKLSSPDQLDSLLDEEQYNELIHDEDV